MAEFKGIVTFGELDKGIHMRSSAMLVKACRGFESEIVLSKGAETADAKSMMDVMMLGVISGDSLELRCAGPDAAEAFLALKRLFAGDDVDGIGGRFTTIGPEPGEETNAT